MSFQENMKAFVKVNNGTFPNLNFYMAWEGFNVMGYSVTLFEEKDIPNLDITRETPVFAGVTVFRKVIDQLGVNYPPFDCYPSILNPYYGRKFSTSTLGAVKRDYNRNEKPVFVKPIKPKVFTGVVINSLLNLIPIAAVPDDTAVYVCDPLPPIVSEFRAYVHDRDLLGVKHYFGDWSVVPDKNVVEEVIEHYNPSPVAYGVDFGVIRKDDGSYKTIVLEANDGCNLGNYGIDSIHYGEMIVSRWTEIMQERQWIPEVKLELRNPPLVARQRILKANWHPEG